jgi:glutamate racemase
MNDGCSAGQFKHASNGMMKCRRIVRMVESLKINVSREKKEIVKWLMKMTSRIDLVVLSTDYPMSLEEIWTDRLYIHTYTI